MTTIGQQMSALIRSHRGTPAATSPKAQEIHSMYKRGLQQIRGNRHMHPDRKRIEAARLYETTRNALGKLRKDQADADTKTLTQLERKLWGYDAERALAVDRATLDTTIRDAQDRAAQLKKPEHAARALADAEQAGDHILARAIGKRAHDMDWSDVVHDYLATRPNSATNYQQAGEIWQRHNVTGARMADSMQYVVHKPEELRNLTDKDIEAMTAEPGDAAA